MSYLSSLITRDPLKVKNFKPLSLERYVQAEPDNHFPPLKPPHNSWQNFTNNASKHIGTSQLCMEFATCVSVTRIALASHRLHACHCFAITILKDPWAIIFDMGSQFRQILCKLANRKVYNILYMCIFNCSVGMYYIKRKNGCPFTRSFLVRSRYN